MRQSDYPIPEYACYIWHRGDSLAVAIPDYLGNGHTLFVPIEKFLAGKGARWLVDMLAERHGAYARKGHSTIGTASEPTGEMLAAYLKVSAPTLKTSTEVDIFAEDDSAAT